MVELAVRSPCKGLLPLSIGTVTVTEVDGARMTSVAPFKGQDKALSEALKAAHGLSVPSPGRSVGRAGARAIWFGQRMTLLMGPAPDPSLTKYAAITDQSDGWAVVRLEGAGARAVLARLTPIDLRPSVFKTGHTARSDLMHMMASVTRVGEAAYQIMVFRGFAETLVKDLRVAMESVATR